MKDDILQSSRIPLKFYADKIQKILRSPGPGDYNITKFSKKEKKNAIFPKEKRFNSLESIYSPNSCTYSPSSKLVLTTKYNEIALAPKLKMKSWVLNHNPGPGQYSVQKKYWKYDRNRYIKPIESLQSFTKTKLRKLIWFPSFQIC